MYELGCDVVTDCLILPYPAFFRQYSEHHFGKAKKKSFDRNDQFLILG